MKVFNLLLAGLCVCALLSCNGKGGTKASQSEQFKTQDLTSFFLQGHVKTVDNGDGSSLTFDDKGRLANIATGFSDVNGQPLVLRLFYDKVPGNKIEGGCTVRRDEEGRLLWVGFKGNGCSGEEGYHFEYAEEGFTYWYDTGECTGFTFCEVLKTDSDGSPLQEKMTLSDEEGNIVTIVDYEYVSKDNHGNWTERKLSIFETEYTYDFETGDEQVLSTSTTERTQKRTISYYE